MKLHRIFIVLASLGWFILEAPAAVYYVSQSSSNPTPPYTGWSTAAVNIQDAINVATNGDEILVTNGVYAAGGRAMALNLTNRVALNKPVTVQSVNGPLVTIIRGAGTTNSLAAVRCAWLTNGASLVGFTLQAGATAYAGGGVTVLLAGAGVWCASTNAMVANCMIISNTAASVDGGAYQGTLVNCLLSGNSGPPAGVGGVAYSVLKNCTVVSNAGTGVFSCLCTNCIIYNNSINFESGPYGACAYCCTTPSPGGAGDITGNPRLFADGVHLLAGSPCIGAGINLVTGTDIFGQPWANPPSMGCAEWTAAPLVTPTQIQLTGNPDGFTMSAAGDGQVPLSYSWLENGVPLTDNGHFSGTQTANLIATGVTLADAGNYQLVVTNSLGAVTSSVSPLVIHCVAAAGTDPVRPYATWAAAATNIQDAITVAAPGDVVLATNGVYAHGGISMDGVITNCVSINKAILVDSVNGPGSTVVQGAWDPANIVGPGAVRCAWLTNSAILAGFRLQGGATRNGSGTAATEGGGVYCASTNVVVYNCVIATNYAAYAGGGAYSPGNATNRATLIHCTLQGNHALATVFPAGGGASGLYMDNCWLISNFADRGYGGGAASCYGTNCAFLRNSAYTSGGAAYNGTLVNCTVTENIASTQSPSSGSSVYGGTLINCIVYGNLSGAPFGPNYQNCTMSYCLADPLPSGTGNIDVNPQLLADGIHLAATSPCIGAGTESVVSGTDIDGQPWENPPAIGCDQWLPTPLVNQPVFAVNSPAHGLTVSVITAGQPPFNYFWSVNGFPISDNGHYVNSGTAGLLVNPFGPDDAGVYQVVVSNALGVVTSQVAQLTIHVVNAAGANPVAPYLTWATAATNIQDAIDAAVGGDIVLVTNGVYAFGGTAVAGNLTNRVALNKPLTVTSVNGYAVTTIEGAWDPVSTNGPGAVRCAYVADGAILSGFTLEKGATQAAITGFIGGPWESGGGVWCNSSNGVVANCVLSNNCAIYGGGIDSGTLNNSYVTANQAYGYGGGSYYAVLNNCTMAGNFVYTPSSAGTYYGTTENSIVVNNYYVNSFGIPSTANYYPPGSSSGYYYSCTSPTISGNGNINADPQFLDSLFHIAINSPCEAAGNPLYAGGADLDGEAWTNPPAMGCDEVILADLTGPLVPGIDNFQTNVLVNWPASFSGFFSGRASRVQWSFGDGQTVTNTGAGVAHVYTNAGIYTVTFTVFNNDYPAGVSARTMLTVVPLNPVQLQSAVISASGFQFQFVAQKDANYTVQYATNLAPPVVWNTLQNIYFSPGGVTPITDSTAPTTTRFYRVLAQSEP